MSADETKILLVVDDEPAQARLVAAIASRAGWRTEVAGTADAAQVFRRSAVGAPVRAILVDIWSPDIGELALVKDLIALAPDCPMLVLTAQSRIALAVEAMRAGACDFLVKPIAPESLIEALNLAAATGGARGELRPLGEKEVRTLPFETMIGSAPDFRAALAVAAKAARSRVPVLIEGEAGVGKTLFARAIHAASPRSKRPLIELDCAATPANFIASRLFGHKKGAFAGAFDEQQGVLTEAEGATVFIDNIGAIPFDIQALFAKALENGEYTAIGGKRSFEFDVRLIAGASSDLKEQVEAGNFREDLYYRLNIVSLSIPPLRARIGDLPSLARHFLARLAEKKDLPSVGITDDALGILMRFDWPGNIRQLQDTLFRAAIGCKGAALTSKDFPEIEAAIRLSSEKGGAGPLHVQPFAEGPGVALYEADGHIRPLSDIEADLIRLAIGHYRGRMTEVAKRLGIGRSTLYRKLSELGIDTAA